MTEDQREINDHFLALVRSAYRSVRAAKKYIDDEALDDMGRLGAGHIHDAFDELTKAFKLIGVRP